MQHRKIIMKFLYLIFHLSLYSLPSFCILTKGNPVLDADGNHLQTGTDYYILPLETRNGGGLALSAKDHPCPLYVIQEQHESSKGHPLRFFSSDKNQNSINASTDVNIVFMAETICVQSTAWRVGGIDFRTGHRYVMISGGVGNPGPGTVTSWFKLEKHEKGKGYKIVFCPSVCPTCRVACGNLGVFVENGIKWLGLSKESMAIQLKKA